MNRATKKALTFYASMKTGISEREVNQVLDAVFESMRNALMRGDSIVMDGVGTLKPVFKKKHNTEIMSVHFRKSPKLRAKFDKVVKSSAKISSLQEALKLLK